ncbi:speckle-type POZ protein-like B [Stegodyphus dumicola]|uniref:speckle-type POZ protein-like B n=1 Tax=Stegodyphus dumicola TaxID=202533 RepID=UPI0015AAABE9|nr:speckle-type POZ protein-like B [Stegodyphus dumicola]
MNKEFEMTWIIENFNMCHHSTGFSLRSPTFVLSALPGMMWCLDLYPRGEKSKEYIDVLIMRCDDLPQKCEIEYSLCTMDKDENPIQKQKKEKHTFEAGKGWGCSSFFERKRYLNDKDNLVINCDLRVLQVRDDNDQKHLRYDFMRFHLNELFTDITLRTSDTTFKVHKCLLSIRWPALVEKLDKTKVGEEFFDVETSVLEAIIIYIYSGLLICNNSQLISEVFAAAVKYELSNLRCNVCLPVVNFKARTRINAEETHFIWKIPSLITMSNNASIHSDVFSVDLLEFHGWKLSFHLLSRSSESASFDIFLCKVYGDNLKPIFVKSRILCSSYFDIQSEHLFHADVEWKCADACDDFDDDLLLDCHFTFTDVGEISEITRRSFFRISSSSESNQSFETYHQCVDYVSDDLRTLYNTGKLSDVQFVAGSEIFCVHKVVLSARSQVFSRMFENEMVETKSNTINIQDIEPAVLKTMLYYMYTADLDQPLKECAFSLYEAADKYGIYILRAKCASFLKSNLTVKNVCKVLLLADMHDDKKLCKKVQDFIAAHAVEVFATDEWPNFVNMRPKTAAKVLQQSVVVLCNDSKKKSKK